MLGRRLDRYITSFFFWHFIVCFLAIMGLYVIIDTFSHLDDFVRYDNMLAQARAIVTYHVYQLPVLVGQFLPIVVLMGGVISLARLSAYNELNATKAAGVSIQRTVLPVFLTALVIGLLGAADQELLVPLLEQDILDVRDRSIEDHDTYRDLFTFDDKQRTSVMVRRLLNAAHGFQLERVEATPREPAKGEGEKPSAWLRAASGVWVGRWVFLFDGATIEPGGEAKPFASRTLLADVAADKFSPPRESQARLADGTPCHAVGAKLDGRALDLAFAACEPISRQRMILRGQITSVKSGEPASAPIDIKVALWRDKQWLGRAQTYIQRTPEKRELIVYDGEPLPLSLPPQELIQTRTDPSLKSFAELRRLASRIPTLRQRILLDLYTRTAFPLANVVLLLVAIPLLFQQEGGKSTLLGVGLALFVSLCFYVVTYAFQTIGRDPEGIFGGIPWLAAWLPIVLFGGGGCILLWNMDT